MNKHTDGPWHVFDNREDKGFERCDVARMGVGSKLHADVAHCYAHSSDRTDEETLANCKLIAAAPDLLAALNEVMPLIRFTDDDGWNAVKRARAAITKATE